ncbi:MAG: hypothetical protein EBQ89_10885 [Alphaproteobacteria bacterium]|nr:hypothetical protein [Alphaproteobacteria bacterium]
MRNSEKLVAAAFQLARQAWPVPLSALAKKAKLSPRALSAMGMATHHDVLNLMVAHTTGQITHKPVDGACVRDKLFELLMQRMDLLSPHRPALNNIINSAARHAPTALHLARAQRAACQAMLKHVGADPSPLLPMGLMAVYACTLQSFLADTTPDLSRTMAALDRHLGRAEKIWGVLRCENTTGK